MGTLVTNFSHLRTGAVQRANGGYLVLQARDVLVQPMVWETLKRPIETSEIRIENLGEQLSVIPVITLRPEAVKLEVQVILLGEVYLYSLLFRND